MMCEKCIYRKNCQFLFKHRKAKVASCTAFKSESELKAEAIREFAERLKELSVYGTIREYSYANNISYMLEDMVSEGIDNLVMEMTEEKK